MRSLVRATDIDVLPPDRELTRRSRYWVVRSPSNPQHFWGNWLLYDAPPAPGDGARWEADFNCEFPALTHRAFAWDTITGETGAACVEFRGFEVENLVGLVARPEQLHDHPRADAEVEIRALDVDDDAAWDQVAELWMAQNLAAEHPHPVDLHRSFTRSRLTDLRAIFRQGRGAWFGAFETGSMVGSLGIVVTGTRARYQQVDTLASHRGRGIASRLVLEAARRTLAVADIASLVIVADADYHALGIYESLGFGRVEHVHGVWRRPSGVGAPPTISS